MSFPNIIFFISVIAALALYSAASDDLVVQVANGKVRGVKQVGFEGNTVHSFMSIPYAKPPVGPLRFSPPEPAEKWEGIRDATKYGPTCIQQKMEGLDKISLEIIQKENMDEDCLTLDVYVPEKKVETQPLAVMVWIHGGGFTVGYGQLPDGENVAANYTLLRGDVILVGMNYRLGPFGFFSTGDENALGNWGLRDQALGLAWIKSNIAAFGGDPQRVTIFGISAGGVSVNALLMSPYTRDLFNRAIAQSGVMSSAMLSFDPLDDALRLAQRVNCTNSGQRTGELVECLRKIPAQSLLDAANLLSLSPDDGKPFRFLPVVDEDFLPNGPPLLERNKAEKELMVGFIDMEGYVFPLNFMVPTLPEDFMTVRPSITQSEFDQAISQFSQHLRDSNGEYGTDECAFRQITEAIKFAYTDWNNFDDGYRRLDMVVKLWGDVLFGIPAIRVAKNRGSSNGSASTYLYHLTYKSSSEKLKELTFYAPKWLNKATHGEDAFYMFTPFLSFFNERERKMSADMVKYWTNFARTGNPNKPSLRPGMSTWETFNNDSENYLEFGEILSTKSSSDLEAEYVYFWADHVHKLVENSNCREIKDEHLLVKYLTDIIDWLSNIF